MQISHNEFIEDKTGVLLAGGRSRSMGHDKTLIEIGRRPLLFRSLDLPCLYEINDAEGLCDLLVERFMS